MEVVQSSLGLPFVAKSDQPLDIVWSRPLPDGVEPSTVTVTIDAAGRWFVSLRTATTY